MRSEVNTGDPESWRVRGAIRGTVKENLRDDGNRKRPLPNEGSWSGRALKQVSAESVVNDL